MIDMDMEKNATLFFALKTVSLKEKDGDVLIDVPFQAASYDGVFKDVPGTIEHLTFRLTAYGDSILRFSGTTDSDPLEETSVMLQKDPALTKERLYIERAGGVYRVFDEKGIVRFRLSTEPFKINHWSDLQPPPDPMIEAEFYPDGKVPVKFMSNDHFFPGKFESVSLGYLQYPDEQKKNHTLFSFHAKPEEKFFGTGERFGRLNLAGRTIILENTDALGTNSRKAYKNIPFYVSERGYGLFMHTSAHVRLSFSDISNRAVQGMVDDGRLDLFLIGGGNPERVIYNYRTLTGFSPELPVWSYGMWMSRMTYVSAGEVNGIVDRLRKESYPCDVIHLDTGYFEKDWVCEWSFSKKRFPHPAQFIENMRKKGFYISVWQTPNIGEGNCLYDEAVAHRYLPKKVDSEDMISLSDFSGQNHGGQIDFSNPDAVEWYKSLVKRLLDLGVKCIKTDFGEKIDINAEYKTLPYALLQNRYALLYQKAAFEETAEYTDKPFIWGRSSWAGGQRYPLHWGGDTAANWDGLAASLRGGLEFGLSGFTYWSHDIPGFHSLPDFMNTPPTENLYLRWTQFGVFSSHMRYHGSYPREPWEYPGVAAVVRKWLRLRYALIPYIVHEAKYCTVSGRAVINPLFLDYPDDPVAWNTADEYMFGRSLLVAPIMNDEGTRSVYIPAGDWISLFTGEKISGPGWLPSRVYGSEEMPVFVKSGSSVPVYPERVLCTDEMDMKKTIQLPFDRTYRGIGNSLLGEICDFTEESIKKSV
jgi:alpha-D-xyloside xylohydrolase